MSPADLLEVAAEPFRHLAHHHPHRNGASGAKAWSRSSFIWTARALVFSVAPSRNVFIRFRVVVDQLAAILSTLSPLRPRCLPALHREHRIRGLRVSAAIIAPQRDGLPTRITRALRDLRLVHFGRAYVGHFWRALKRAAGASRMRRRAEQGRANAHAHKEGFTNKRGEIDAHKLINSGDNYLDAHRTFRPQVTPAFLCLRPLERLFRAPPALGAGAHAPRAPRCEAALRAQTPLRFRA